MKKLILFGLMMVILFPSIISATVPGTFDFDTTTGMAGDTANYAANASNGGFWYHSFNGASHYAWYTPIFINTDNDAILYTFENNRGAGSISWTHTGLFYGNSSQMAYDFDFNAAGGNRYFAVLEYNADGTVNYSNVDIITYTETNVYGVKISPKSRGAEYYYKNLGASYYNNSITDDGWTLLDNTTGIGITLNTSTVYYLGMHAYRDSQAMYYGEIPGNSLTFSNWNMTSNGGCTNWNTNQSNPCGTSDSTPTITFDTNLATSCRVEVTDANYTTAGPTRNCSTTGSTSHICTIIAGDALSIGANSAYVACNFSENVTSDSGALALIYYPTPSAMVHTVTNGSTNQNLTVLLNATLLDDDSATINSTFIDASDNSTICVNVSVANNTQATCSWSGLKSNTSHSWWINVTDGFSSFNSGIYQFTTEENLFQGYTKDSSGTIVPLSTVVIINQSDDSVYGTTASNASGYWSYPINYSGTYAVCGYNESDTTLRGDCLPNIVVS